MVAAVFVTWVSSEDGNDSVCDLFQVRMAVALMVCV